jgi:hypothetical protein
MLVAMGARGRATGTEAGKAQAYCWSSPSTRRIAAGVEVAMGWRSTPERIYQARQAANVRRLEGEGLFLDAAQAWAAASEAEGNERTLPRPLRL